MTVIAAGVVNKKGHVVLSRNFIEITRIRIEGLLSAFPRLLESSVNKQVTYIDAGTVRYVYQPLEEMFLVLVTTKSSNIVEDLATLHLMGRLIPEYVDNVTEASLDKNAFRIIFALDEVIVGGKRENTTVEQIKTYLEMNSHEEMMVREAKRLQMERAKKDASRKAHEMRDKRRKGMNPYSGIGSNDPGYSGFGSGSAAPVISDGGGVNNFAGVHTFTSTATSSRPAAAQKRSAGLTLTRAKEVDITSRVLREAGLPQEDKRSQQISSPRQTTTTAKANDAVEGLHVVVAEKVSAQLGRDGEDGTVDIRGELSVLVTDPQLASVRLVLSPMSSDYSFRAHAKVNKEMFAEDHVLAMRDNKPLPLQQPVTILRWRLADTASARPPIALSCWPSAASVTVEYELHKSTTTVPLHDVRVVFPLHGATVGEVTVSVGSYDIANGCVVWTIPLVDAQNNATGNVEIELADGDDGGGDSVFFPVSVSFTASQSLGNVQVIEAVLTDSGTPVRFSQETSLVTDTYTVA